MGGSSKKVTVGYKYYIGMHMVLCHGPVDSVRRIIVDGKTAWVGDVADGQITINSANLFGGESREGGISGKVDVMGGGIAQGVNSYLQSKIGGLIPSFRGVTSLVLRQVYVGLNPYLKKWSFRVSRIHKRFDGQTQWYDAKSDIKPAASAILDGPWQYEVIPYHDDPGYEQLTPPGNWQGEDTLPLGSNKVWLYPTPPGWPTPQLSICWIRKVVFDVPEGLVIQLRADNGCLLWINGQYIGASNRDNTPIGSNEQYPVNFVVPARGTYEILGKAFSESSSGSQAGNVVSVTLENIPGGSDMNPAHIIRECLTDPDWGMGYAESDIDDVSFMACADKLYFENMGISILWDRQTAIEDFIKEIVKHIDAALYVDRFTGKFKLKLIRFDYDENTLLELDETNIDKVTDFSRPAFGELTNSVSVNYWDSETNTDASVTLQDIALAQMQGVTINTTVQYPGFTNKTTATKVAERDLKTLSTPLITCTIYANTDGASLNIGDVFKFTWPDYEVFGVVMRVTGIAYGDGKNNRVRINATQDVFNLPDSVIIEPPPPEWVDPNEPPVAVANRIVFEVPYLELVQQNGQTATDGELSANPEVGYVGAAALRPQSNAINARLMTNDGGGFEDIGALDFCPGAFLNEAVDIVDSFGNIVYTFSIKNAIETENVSLGTWCQIDSEIMEVVALSENEITVKRGCLDTVPTKHAEDTPIYFWDAYAQGSPTEYVQSDTIDVRLLTGTGGGELLLEEAPEDSLTIVGRAARPYPPGNFKVNGAYFPSEIDLEEPVLLSWSHRDRIQQTGASLIDFATSDIGPESGVSYLVEAEAIMPDNSTNTFYSENVGSVTSKEIDLSIEVPPTGYAAIVFKVASVRSGIQSLFFQTNRVNVLKTPYDLQAIYTE